MSTENANWANQNTDYLEERQTAGTGVSIVGVRRRAGWPRHPAQHENPYQLAGGNFVLALEYKRTLTIIIVVRISEL